MGKFLHLLQSDHCIGILTALVSYREVQNIMLTMLSLILVEIIQISTTSPIAYNPEHRTWLSCRTTYTFDASPWGKEGKAYIWVVVCSLVTGNLLLRP
ncbi:MAG: hypothetical protein KAV98_02360 [Dehalococcoidia bacterium]|nr:hypothetical protein [Dehalococcoidia bacterium]